MAKFNKFIKKATDKSSKWVSPIAMISILVLLFTAIFVAWKPVKEKFSQQLTSQNKHTKQEHVQEHFVDASCSASSCTLPL